MTEAVSSALQANQGNQSITALTVAKAANDKKQAEAANKAKSQASVSKVKGQVKAAAAKDKT